MEKKERLVELNGPLLQVFRVLALLFFILGFRWYIYRIVAGTIRDTYSGMFFAAEFAMFLRGLLSVLEVIRTPRKPLPPLDIYNLDNKVEIPHVDVWITCYKEDAKTIQRTILSCTFLEYPTDKLHIYLLDDGHRPELRRFCRRLSRSVKQSLQYISRSNNAHGKAGNLNNALEETKNTPSKYILLLDNDMIVKEDAILNLIPYFLYPSEGIEDNNKVALVQGPQNYHTIVSTDPFASLSLLYYRLRLVSLNTWGASPCVGMSCVHIYVVVFIVVAVVV